MKPSVAHSLNGGTLQYPLTIYVSNLFWCEHNVHTNLVFYYKKMVFYCHILLLWGGKRSQLFEPIETGLNIVDLARLTIITPKLIRINSSIMFMFNILTPTRLTLTHSTPFSGTGKPYGYRECIQCCVSQCAHH